MSNPGKLTQDYLVNKAYDVLNHVIGHILGNNNNNQDLENSQSVSTIDLSEQTDLSELFELFDPSDPSDPSDPEELAQLFGLHPHAANKFSLNIMKLPPGQLNFMELPILSAIPNIVDLRSRMPPVYNQGQLGSCTANALCAAIQYLDMSMQGSRLFVYYNERMLEQQITTDSGAYIHDGIATLQRFGVCQESAWPYISSKFSTQPPLTCYTQALAHKALRVQNIPDSLPAMKTALAMGYPIVFGMQIFPSFLTVQVAKTGIVPMPKPTEQSVGGHCQLIVGNNDTTQMFIVRNSWGSSWGAEGYCYIPYAYLTNPNLTSDLWYISAVTK